MSTNESTFLQVSLVLEISRMDLSDMPAFGKGTNRSLAQQNNGLEC